MPRPRWEDWPYYDSTCSVCWETFTSTVSQADADRMRREHDCKGSPNGPAS